MTKGDRFLNALVGLEIEGGYGINDSYLVYLPVEDRLRAPTPEEADRITPETQRTLPLFAPFTNALLTNPNLGASAAASFLTGANVLAKAIPAQSFAVGSTSVDGFGQTGENNFVLSSFLLPSGSTDVWTHSDFIHYPYQRNRRLYKHFILIGGLQ